MRNQRLRKKDERKKAERKTDERFRVRGAETQRSREKKTRIYKETER